MRDRRDQSWRGSNGNFDERRTSSEVKNWISPRNFLKSIVLRVLPQKISSTFVDRSKKKWLKVCHYWNRSLLHHRACLKVSGYEVIGRARGGLGANFSASRSKATVPGLELDNWTRLFSSIPLNFLATGKLKSECSLDKLSISLAGSWWWLFFFETLKFRFQVTITNYV